jgi:hypothetical protein
MCLDTTRSKAPTHIFGAAAQPGSGGRGLMRQQPDVKTRAIMKESPTKPRTFSLAALCVLCVFVNCIFLTGRTRNRTLTLCRLGGWDTLHELESDSCLVDSKKIVLFEVQTIPHGGMGEWGNATWPKKSFPNPVEYGKDRQKQDLKHEGWMDRSMNDEQAKKTFPHSPIPPWGMVWGKDGQAKIILTPFHR